MRVHVLEAAGGRAVVTEAADVWERSPDRQGRLGPGVCRVSGQGGTFRGEPGRRPQLPGATRPSPVGRATEHGARVRTGVCQGVEPVCCV